MGNGSSLFLLQLHNTFASLLLRLLDACMLIYRLCLARYQDIPGGKSVIPSTSPTRTDGNSHGSGREAQSGISND